MADLKNMTIDALRDLARKVLGRGHSRLETKGDLVQALQGAEKNVTQAAGKAAARAKDAGARAAKATGDAAARVKDAGARAAKATGEAAVRAKDAGGRAAKATGEAAARVKDAGGRAAKATGDAAARVKDAGGRAAKATGDAAARVKNAGGRAAKATGEAAARVKDAGGRAAKVTGKAMDAVREGAGVGREIATGAARVLVATAMTAQAVVETVQKSAAATKARKKREEEEPGADEGEAAGSAGEAGSEGHMIARIAGEAAAQNAPHPMTEDSLPATRAERRSVAPAPVYEEHLGELPPSYGDDALVALPCDPTTLYVYWDHADATLRSAWQGLEGGRPQIWVFGREADGGWTRIRTVDFALESRSYFVHDLDPGRIYRAEIHLVDRQGNDRMLPNPSNEMMLPPAGPSPVVNDRFMRILWAEPLQAVLREDRAGGSFSEEIRAQLARLSDWTRFTGRAWGGSAGGMGGRPSSPGAPTSPTASSPAAPWGWYDGGES